MADNDLIIPVKLILDFTLVNLNSNNKPFTITIPAKTVGKVLSVWKPIKVGSNYKWTFTWSTSLSDSSKYLNLKNYSLPFFKHSSIKLTQKPGGIFSHKGVFAYDFAMPIGTPILAAKSGRVVMVKDDSSIGGNDKNFLNQANYVCIYHADGSVANYAHLNTKGVLVREGEFVNQGQLIAYSGNTGYADGPHLHFELLNTSTATQAVGLDWKTLSGDILTIKPGLGKWYKQLTRLLL